MPLLGLRFFTVYGPWGRPDMAYWSFTKAILDGKPIAVFNEGRLQRDFTYVDDIVGGVLAVALEPTHFSGEVPHRIYNIGNNRPVPLMRFIDLIERFTGREAVKVMKPMQPGDVPATHASIDRLAADYGYAPSTPLEVGLRRFVEWYMKREGR
jgi:UDP-glucuronate 4-epimerase